jgi:hypothetical protein
VVIAGHQQTTHEWWDTRSETYELCISQLVRKEAGAGDLQAAQERLEVLKAMTVGDLGPSVGFGKVIDSGRRAARKGCGRRIAYCRC